MKNSTYTFQVAKIVFEKDGYAIVKTTQGASVSGRFKAQEGYCYKSEGRWETHPTYGPQYKLESAVAVRMTAPEALGKFLVLKMKGQVGEAVIGALVEACDTALDLEDMLDKSMRDELIACVGTRNAKKIDLILDAWPKIKPSADLMSPLLGYGLSEACAETCLALWGNKAVAMVEERPFDLVIKVSGVAFLTASRIADKVGISKTDPVRLRAALATGLRDATAMGDLGVKRDALIAKTMPLVNEAVIENGRRKLAPGVELVVSQALLERTLDEMIKGVKGECNFSSHLIEAPDAKGNLVVWYEPLIRAEQQIAARLRAFNAPANPDLLARVAEFASASGATLAPEQQAAVEMVLQNPVSIVTGGPGCGKSFLLKVVLAAFDAAGLKGNLAAPTGKAAKRITESTGRHAQTLHSLIGFAGGGGAAFNESCPLPSQYLVIDEASMVDTELMAATLSAASNNCRIIIVGDVDQLASVGPGQVLRDLINSKVLPVTRLTKGFRFSGGIASAARAINAGKVPETSEDGQFVVVDTEEPAKELMAFAKKLLSEGVSENDIQVLSPTHRGDAGCTALNKAMQQLLNPEEGAPGQKLKRESGDIRVGDRVMQTRNNRELKVVNGDIGWIDALSSDGGNVVFSLPDRDKPVLMDRKQAQDLSLAYAITVHKSQGAEAPYVLLALDKSATFMLRRSLVYTGVTRGSKKVVVFSSPVTFDRAVRMGEPVEGSRRTALVPKVQEAFSTKKPESPQRDAQASSLLDDLDDLPF